MIHRFIARILLLLVGVAFIWNEHDRSRWVKWFKIGGF